MFLRERLHGGNGIGKYKRSGEPAPSSLLLTPPHTHYHLLQHPQVLARLNAWQERLPSPCQLVLLPSLRDAHAAPVFPQPPLELPPAMDDAACLQNPALFDAGGLLTIAATSQDVLRALAGSELQRGPQADRIAALASHLLGQRR